MLCAHLQNSAAQDLHRAVAALPHRRPDRSAAQTAARRENCRPKRHTASVCRRNRCGESAPVRFYCRRRSTMCGDAPSRKIRQPCTVPLCCAAGADRVRRLHPQALRHAGLPCRRQAPPPSQGAPVCCRLPYRGHRATASLAKERPPSGKAQSPYRAAPAPCRRAKAKRTSLLQNRRAALHTEETPVRRGKETAERHAMPRQNPHRGTTPHRIPPRRRASRIQKECGWPWR